MQRRLDAIAALGFKDHYEAKAALQQEYFGMQKPDDAIPIFAFIGRITEQKGITAAAAVVAVAVAIVAVSDGRSIEHGKPAAATAAWTADAAPSAAYFRICCCCGYCCRCTFSSLLPWLLYI